MPIVHYDQWYYIAYYNWSRTNYNPLAVKKRISQICLTSLRKIPQCQNCIELYNQIYGNHQEWVVLFFRLRPFLSLDNNNLNKELNPPVSQPYSKISDKISPKFLPLPFFSVSSPIISGSVVCKFCM